MYRVELLIDDDILDAIADGARKSPGLMRTTVRRNMGRLRRRMLARLREEPPPPQYPIDWQTRRQQAAYFASDGFGHGIPYVRSHTLVNSYDVVLNAVADGGEFAITNDAPHHIFVAGDFAQRMHLATGWLQTATVVSEFEDEAADLLIESWFTVVDPHAGVPR